MFPRLFFTTLFISVAVWYFHEYHPVAFMKITKNIPYISPLMADLHRSLKPTKSPSADAKEMLFTPEELAEYKGEQDGKGLYIAILGKVFNVENGAKHYKPGSGYHVFTGRDASRAFVTGDFSEEKASDDVIDLSHSEILSLENWVKFYEEQYEYKGKLVGRYFTASGEKTQYHRDLDWKMIEALKEQGSNKEEKRKFPPCNTSWSASEGSRVWCTTKSGGISRNWAGVPRKLYKVGSDKFECVCVDLEQIKDETSPVYARRGHLEEYQDCHPSSFECWLS